MPTVTDLKAQITAYMNRTPSTLVVQGQDLVLLAINRAKRAAQREVDFELAKVEIDVTVDLSAGGDLGSAVLSGTTTPVAVHKLLRAFVAAPGGQRPLDLVTRDEFYRRLGSSWDANVPWQQWVAQAKQVVPCDTPSVIRYANTVAVWPATAPIFNGLTTTKVSFDATQWMPDYLEGSGIDVATDDTTHTAGNYSLAGLYLGLPYYQGAGVAGTSLFSLWSDGTNWYISPSPGLLPSLGGYYLQANSQQPAGTYVGGGAAGWNNAVVGAVSFTPAVQSDFFLTYCDDWLLYRSIRELNFLLRDNERVPIAQAVLNDAWSAVKAWNDDLAGPQTYNLD